MTDHPMQPPPELIVQWLLPWTYEGQGPISDETIYASTHESMQRLITSAYIAGADAQLRADAEWIRQRGWTGTSFQLRADMRPKPPTLKKQALEALDCIEADFNTVGDRAATIRKALEQIND